MNNHGASLRQNPSAALRHKMSIRGIAEAQFKPVMISWNGSAAQNHRAIGQPEHRGEFAPLTIPLTARLHEFVTGRQRSEPVFLKQDFPRILPYPVSPLPAQAAPIIRIEQDGDFGKLTTMNQIRIIPLLVLPRDERPSPRNQHFPDAIAVRITDHQAASVHGTKRRLGVKLRTVNAPKECQEWNFMLVQTRNQGTQGTESHHGLDEQIAPHTLDPWQQVMTDSLSF